MSWSAGRKPHYFVDVVAGDRKVQVAISPTGRSVRVYVDGEEIGADGATVGRGD